MDMKQKAKALIYPFNMELSPLVRHANLIQDYEIYRVVSPKGWGYSGKDAGCADYGHTVGLKVDSDFENALDQVDTVIFIDSGKKMDEDKLIYPKIIKAAENRKNIICTFDLEDEFINKVADICRGYNTSFKYFCTSNDNTVRPNAEIIYPINIPVIFVLGLSEKTHKFEIQLALRDCLQKRGYKISQIGSRHYCDLMGFHSFPEFMFSKSLAEHEKVALFNHYVKNIEIKEKSDVIVIGIPGGVMPFNNKFTNKFGILAYEVSQAVLPDAAILSTLYDTCKPEYYEMLSTSIKYKLGYEIDCYNMSNIAVDWETTKSEQSLSYTSIDWQYINEIKQQYNGLKTPVYNILDKNDSDNMTDFLIDKLEGYSKTQVI